MQLNPVESFGSVPGFTSLLSFCSIIIESFVIIIIIIISQDLKVSY